MFGQRKGKSLQFNKPHFKEKANKVLTQPQSKHSIMEQSKGSIPSFFDFQGSQVNRQKAEKPNVISKSP